METLNAERIIILVDMDCFYVQVEQNLCPDYQNKPCAVVQYNAYKGGGIIAVNYEARAKGVSRMLRGDEAKKLCPDIHLFRVPEVRGKADLTRYREAGAKVLDVLCEYSDCVERASIDEAYLDMTSVITEKMKNTPPVTPEQLPNTFVIGWENADSKLRKDELQRWLQMIYEEDHLYNDRMLAVAAVIAEEMRTSVFEKTGYRCSAGIAHNKMLAKLSCGIHKPNKQTVLPQSSIQLLYNTISIKKVRNLGGKFGEEVMKKFSVEKMDELFHIPKSQIISAFGEKTGCWLYNLARGIENEPVTSRQLPKSIGCGKNFPGKTSLSTKDQVTHWLKQLSLELEERLLKDRESNRRVARLLTISVKSFENDSFSVVSRSCPIYVYNSEKLAHDALHAISKLNTSSSDVLWKPSIWTLSMAASKFEDKLDNSFCNIQSYLVNSKNSAAKYENNSNESSLLSSASYENFENNICHNKTSEIMKNSMLCKSTKNSKQNITSFFKKKEISRTASCNSIANLSENVVNGEDIDSLEKSPDLPINFTKDEFPNDGANSVIANVGRTSDSPEKQQKSRKGFFAKKLAEHSEFCFDIKLQEISTDNNKNEPLNMNNSNFLSESTHVVNSSELAHSDILNSSIKADETVLTNLDPELIKICDKCNKHIPVWEESEHLDYHLAVSLSNDLSEKPISSQNCLFNKPSPVGAVATKHKRSGRKRGSTTKSSLLSKKQVVQTNTLDSFIKSGL